MTIEEKLKMLIVTKYGSVVNFSKRVGLPNSTVVNVLTRGVHKSGVDNVIKICKELEISVDALAAQDKIVPAEKEPQAEKTDIAVIYTALMRRLLIGDDVVIDGEELTIQERYTLYDSLELDLEKIRRHHERERREK